ncbi:MAG: gamma carbonic anhydrase family protein [Clostridium perfringens]|nr:gamma carbonic anhydrase family protein [Clostridium perfringens]
MIKSFKDAVPKISSKAYIAENATIIGNVNIKENASIWFGSVLRGDVGSITIGKRSNVQDNSVIHVDKDLNVIIGDDVTIGHSTIIHGCYIGNNSLIGMGSVILNGAKIGNNTLIGAKTLITQNKSIPDGVLVLGNPGKVIRKLTEDEILSLKKSAENYVTESKEYI